MTPPNFRELIGRELERQGRGSQVRLARAARVPAPNLNAYLKGKTTITADVLERLLGAIGCSCVIKSPPRTGARTGSK